MLNVVRALIVICLGSGAAARAEAVKFADLAGWWSAEPTFAGESSRVVLHLLEDEGKPSARISLPAIGVYEAPIGTATLTENRLEMQPHAFTLSYDPARSMLVGVLPEAAVPVYKIPVQFQRSEPLTQPAPVAWNARPPKVRWKAQVSGAVSAGLAYDPPTRTLYIGTDAGTLHALDERGHQKWQVALGGPIKATATIVGDNVYVHSDAGFVYQLDKSTGAERWRAKVDSGSPPRIPPSEEKSRWDRYASSVVAAGDSVYVASRDKHLYALSAQDGAQRWRVASNDLITSTPAIYNDAVVFASFDGKVRAVAIADGAVRWTYDAKLAVSGDVAIADGRVIIGSRSYDLIALDAKSGRELWKHYYWFSWIESPAVILDGIVYTGSSDGVGVYALDAATGKRLWRTSVPGWAWARVAADRRYLVSGTVGQGRYPGNRTGALVGLARDTGAIRWIYIDPPTDAAAAKKEWGFAAGPVIAGDTVYAADLNGQALAIALD